MGGENEVGMEISSSQDALRRASEICGVPAQVLRVAELSELSAYFVAEPVRSGVQMIVSKDVCSVLSGYPCSNRSFHDRGTH